MCNVQQKAASVIKHYCAMSRPLELTVGRGVGTSRFGLKYRKKHATINDLLIVPPSPRFSDLPTTLQCPVHVASHISKESYIESSSVFCVCTMSLTRNVKYENSHGTSFKGRSQ